MEYDKLPSNSMEPSKVPTSEKRIVKKVVSGKSKKKKNELRNIKDEFIKEDIRTIKDYVVTDVIIPTLKNAISDVIRNGIDILLFGESGGQRNRSSGGRVSYSSYYDKSPSKRSESRDGRSRVSTVYKYDDVIYNSRSEAEEVLLTMEDMLNKFKYVSIGDLYDLSGVSGNYTDHDWGWITLSRVSIRHCRDGYYIDFPKPQSLK